MPAGSRRRCPPTLAASPPRRTGRGHRYVPGRRRGAARDLTIGPVTAEDRNNTTALLAAHGHDPAGHSRRPRGDDRDQGRRRVQRRVPRQPLADAGVSSGSPAPVIGKAVNATPVNGKVFVRLPNGPGFVPLTGRNNCRSAPRSTRAAGRSSWWQRRRVRKRHRSERSAGRYSGSPSPQRAAEGTTTLSLLEGAFPGGPSYESAAPAERSRGSQPPHPPAPPRHRQGPVQDPRTLRAATVRGTTWDTADRCDGTLTRVRRGIVTVTDLVRHKTVAVRAGHSYLAKPR